MTDTAMDQAAGGFWRLCHDDLAASLRRHDLPGEALRVYLAVADLTIGYGNPRDAVSLGQVSEHTGIARRHVARAIRRLEAAGLAGHAPGKRQALTRWVAWPAPAVPEAGTVPGAGTAPEAGNTTAPEAGNKTVPKGVPRAGTHQDSKKEEATKKVAAKAPQAAGEQATLLPDDQAKPAGRGRGKGKGKVADPRVAAFIDSFATEYQARLGRKYVVAGGKDGRLVKALLGRVSLDDLKRAAGNMLADPFWRDQADIGTLSSKLNRFLGATAGGNGKARFIPAGKALEADYGAVTKRFD
jgi:phage replication O-like protein O